VQQAEGSVLDDDGSVGGLVLSGGKPFLAEDAGAGDGDEVSQGAAGDSGGAGHSSVAADGEGTGGDPDAAHALVLTDADLHVLAGQLLSSSGGAAGVITPDGAHVLSHVLGAVAGGLVGAVASDLADLDVPFLVGVGSSGKSGDGNGWVSTSNLDVHVISGKGSTDSWGIVSGASGGNKPASSGSVSQAHVVGDQDNVLEVQPQLTDVTLASDGVSAAVCASRQGRGVVHVGDVCVVVANGASASLEGLDTANAESGCAATPLHAVYVIALGTGQTGAHQSATGAAILVLCGAAVSVGEVHHAED